MKRTLTAFLACMLALPAAAAEIYQWIDENGTRRFSNTPPPEGAEIIWSAPESRNDAGGEARRDRDAESRVVDRFLEQQQQKQEADRRAREAAERARAADETDRLRAEKQAAEDRARELEEELARAKRRRRPYFPHGHPTPPVAVPLPAGGAAVLPSTGGGAP